MRKNKLFLLLALLLTAATGAWATDVYLVGNGTGNWLNGVAWDPGASDNKMTEQNGVYSITFNDVDANSELLFKFAINGSWNENFGCTSWDANELNKTLSNIVAGGANFKFGLTEKADVTISFNLSEMTYMISTKGMKVGDDAATGYSVSLKDGVKDADKWTVKVGDGQAQALPIGGLKGDGSETVTLQYTGRLKVKGVKATSEAAQAEASVPDGAINGKFSVSDGKQVYFSKGNLQATYNGSNWTWAFATNQWDYIGNAAGNTSINGGGTISGTGTVDLFGWVGAACEWTGAAQYGISNVNVTKDYGNVVGEALKSDWGTLAITNGGNKANFGWHSLASSEWEYLFQTRTTPSGVRYAHATVNDVPGLVLLPDDWNTDYYSLDKVNDATGTAYTDNVISSSDWTSKLEAHGAVFLPAGGYRNGAEVMEAGVRGNYWSSTPHATSGLSARYLFFGSGRFAGSTTNSTRNRGCSVRLVQATSEAAPAEVTYTLLSAATTADCGKVVCAAGHLHDAKTAVPTGCTAVGILGKVTETGHGLIIALQDATDQNWNTIDGWTSVTTYAGTTLKVLPDDAARGTNLTSYTALGETAVSNWAVAQKSDYEAIFTNLGSTTSDSDGTTYDAIVNSFITTGVGGTAISGNNWTTTVYGGNFGWDFESSYWNCMSKTNSLKVRPVLGFGGEAAAKEPAAVTTAPTGAAIVGVGKTTALVSGGVAEGGTLMYKVTTENTMPASTDGFSDAVPTAQGITASGKVYVWYYVKGDDTHSDSEIAATAIEVPVADVVWDATNISQLEVASTDISYDKEGVKLSANALGIQAAWYDSGDPTQDGILFTAYQSGGFTFTALNGKKFTKIEMKAQGTGGWQSANLGDGWAFNNTTVTWTGSAASTVGLLTGAYMFSGESIISIVFYLSK